MWTNITKKKKKPPKIKTRKKQQRQYNVNNENSLTSGYVGITISGSHK